MESLIFSEFKEKDYIIFDQQILGLELSQSDLEQVLSRILQSKSQSFQDKVGLLLREGKQNLLELAFKRARKRNKLKESLRYGYFEQMGSGE